MVTFFTYLRHAQWLLLHFVLSLRIVIQREIEVEIIP